MLIDRHERYQKQSYRNRTTIVSGNGKMDLSIPTVHDFRMGVIDTVRIDYSTDWQRVHWRTIVSAYNSSPYFLYYKDFLEPFYREKTEFLFDFDMKLIETLLKVLKIKQEITFSNDFVPYSENDLRVVIQPKNARKSHYPFLLKDEYYQVFADKFGFQPNVSILDLLFNTGPQTVGYLQTVLSNYIEDSL